MTITTNTRAVETDRINARVNVAERLADMYVHAASLGVAYGWQCDEFQEAKRSLERIRGMLYDKNGDLAGEIRWAYKEDDLNLMIGLGPMTVGIVAHRTHNRCTSDCGWYTSHAAKDRAGEVIEPQPYHYGLRADHQLPEGHVHTWERDPYEPQPVSWSAHS